MDIERLCACVLSDVNAHIEVFLDGGVTSVVSKRISRYMLLGEKRRKISQNALVAATDAQVKIWSLSLTYSLLTMS